MNNNSMNSQIDFQLLFREVKLLYYLSRILVRNKSFYFYPIYMFIKFCKIYHDKRQYSLKTINEALMDQLGINSTSLEFDENYTVVINNKLMKGKLYAVLTVMNDEQCIQMNVKPFFSESIEKECIFISTSLMFNILNKVASSFTKNSLSASIKASTTGKIGFADEIHLALVSNPYDPESNVVDALIKSYLQTPKLICESDIISIPLKRYSEKQMNLTKIHNFKKILYFKCTKLFSQCHSNNEGHYVAFKETTVKQVANLQSFIPPEVELFSTNHNNGEDHDVFCPSGLKDYAAEIELAVKPFLNRTLVMNPAFLIIGEKGSGEDIIVSNIASKFGMHLYTVTNFDVSAEIYSRNESKLKNTFVNAKLYAPCILYLTNFENFEKNNEGQTDERRISHFINGMKNLLEDTRYPLILFCSSKDDKISTQLKREFLEIFIMKPLTEEERKYNLQWLMRNRELCYGGIIDKLVQRTHTFLFEDLDKLLTLAKSNISSSENNTTLFDGNLFSTIDKMQQQYNENTCAPKVPSVHWDDIGGMKDVKKELIKTLNFLLKHSQFSTTIALRRFGILLFGPPGTGKTLIAKAVATECNLCFLSVKGPELLNMYIGQSEENIRKVFERARVASPCIIFFDELDSLAPNRGLSGDSGGVMDRVVSQLLSEMDGLNEESSVFIIGATNRPDLIDPALLRPGRFDKLLYVGPAMDSASRLLVLNALTKKFKISEDVKLENIVDLCPINISGADFYGICAEAWMHAVRRTIRGNKKGWMENDNSTEMDIVVETVDFNYALAAVTPSITSEDLLFYENLRKEMSCNNNM